MSTILDKSLSEELVSTGDVERLTSIVNQDTTPEVYVSTVVPWLMSTLRLNIDKTGKLHQLKATKDTSTLINVGTPEHESSKSEPKYNSSNDMSLRIAELLVKNDEKYNVDVNSDKSGTRKMIAYVLYEGISCYFLFICILAWY